MEFLIVCLAMKSNVSQPWRKLFPYFLELLLKSFVFRARSHSLYDVWMVPRLIDALSPLSVASTSNLGEGVQWENEHSTRGSKASSKRTHELRECSLPRRRFERATSPHSYLVQNRCDHVSFKLHRTPLFCTSLSSLSIL